MIQLQYLNYLLDSGDKTPLTYDGVDKSFFSDYPNEYQFIQEHLTKFDKIPDKLTFLKTFPRFDIIEVKEPIQYLTEELFKDKNKRDLAKTFNKVRDMIGAGDVDGAMSVYINSANTVVSAKKLSAINVFDDTSRYSDYVERTQDFYRYYVKTGFDEVDSIIGGWDKSEELATIVARPGVGKSWILLKVAISAVEQGLNVGLYSGEMSANKVGYRADTLAGHMSNRSITQGRPEVQNEYKAYIDNMKDKFKGNLWVITPKDLGGQATVSDLRAFVERYNLDMLCIDQHSLLEDERRGRDPVTRASNISRDLKNLQVLKKIPIIAVSQQNRGLVEDGTVIDVSHIAQADRIGQDSTCVLFLEQKDNVLTIHLAKSRDSVSGKKLKYAIDLDRGVFSFVPDDSVSTEQDCNSLKAEFDGEYYGGQDAF